VLFVGDSNADMLAARAAGVRAAAAGWGHQSPTIERGNVDVWLVEPGDVLGLLGGR
jgi:phosphoglycolate phosphatase-like HAD superfamily hydrolase